jgi:hypothetical protein
MIHEFNPDFVALFVSLNLLMPKPGPSSAGVHMDIITSDDETVLVQSSKPTYCWK